MGAVLVSAIITSLRSELVDPSPGATWLDARFLALVNEAERGIIDVKRDAYVVRGAVPLVAGTKQTLPTGGLTLMDVYDNAVSGRRVTPVNRALQDAAAIYFPAATQEVDAQHFMADERDPTHFDVVPPNDGTGSINALYAAVPADLTATTDAIHLADTYEQPIKHFILAKCYAEKTPVQDFNKAKYYEVMWRDAVGSGAKTQKDTGARSANKQGDT